VFKEWETELIIKREEALLHLDRLKAQKDAIEGLKDRVKDEEEAAMNETANTLYQTVLLMAEQHVNNIDIELERVRAMARMSGEAL
jgi:phosphoribosyl-ATP pyrophosphohydrolase